MKYFLEQLKNRRRIFAAVALIAGVCSAITGFAELPSWIRNVEGNSALDAVFFRMMSLPYGAVTFRRPPHETRLALSDQIKAQPHSAELYSLRALEDEQELDAAAAEADWKAYVDNSSDKPNAQLALADFYHRRLRPADEIKTLSAIASAPAIASEKLTPVAQQRSWQAFERIFGVIQAQRLPKDVSIAQYRAWISRYPAESSLYARFMEFLVAQKEYAAATRLIDDYRKQFPSDQVFPVKAQAMLEYRRGSVREGLSVYEQSFEPLWDPRLVKSYFDLLRDTQNLRKFRDDAHAALVANPEDLKAASRLFYYYQQQGKNEAAVQVITEFRLHKEAAKSPWKSQELFTFARLLEDIHSYPESARYYFALYNSKDLPSAQETALAGLTSLLLTAPETPIRLGTGDLSMYRDIATLDQGPGYLNGILSLILNTTQPAAQYSEEEQKAQPYFRRTRATELLALLDKQFPNAARRPELHAQLLEFYSNSGESDAVIQGGREFMASFPSAPQRSTVALLMADAYARKDNSKEEFAIYDNVLKELAEQSRNVPLGQATNEYQGIAYETSSGSSDEREEREEGEGAPSAGTTPHKRTRESFQLNAAASAAIQSGPRSPEYSRVLERYLSRLVQMKQIPAALAVLRREIDRNPDDYGLYERLAVFLDQNRLGSQQEEVYRLAISRFPDKSWYDKLARFYLRHKRDAEFNQLTRDAVASFKGTELERYFNNVVGGGPALYLQLNLYANQRFPHNPVFVRNLLAAYLSPATYDQAAWLALLRQHWFEDAALRNRYFEYLASHHQLESELSAIRQSNPDAVSWEKNPAAATFIAHAELWRSHFEESAPFLKSLATQYPAEPEIAHTASSVYRSLAYSEPNDTAIAAKIEDNFLRSQPADSETLARIGDIYADREQFVQAAPYWERIPKINPGQPDGYLEAATIYWDYFDFDSARRLLATGRQQLSDPNLYAYEAGAIYENERDYPQAIAEYIKSALAAPGSPAEERLLQLARRPRTRDLVDQSTAKIAPLPNPPSSAMGLRVKVLEAQDRKPELESFLDAIANGTTSIEQAENIETLAQQKSLETVRQHSIEKQAALTTDPVTRLQLRYTLIQIYEARKDFTSAQKNVEALYRDNPKILGVVRSTFDFYWRMKMQSGAISVLLQASKDAYPDLSKQFLFEAARKSTDAKQFQQARDLLTGLLKDAPYNGEYLAAMADTYAQAGDDRGLEQFYRDKIAAVKNAQLPAETRKTQIATLRRGLIPALTRMKDYAGAVDQYIELINSFPEDDGLVPEASLYALRYGRQQQLVDFYAKTVAESPRDYRWSMVLARIQANLEDYAAAIDTYAKAIGIRPDRSDLYISRAELEERLMRFDDAAADYEHIYQLAYHDPQWMEKLATVRARQGKTADSVAALQKALVEGRPENARNYFEVARRLETWAMLSESRSYAERGINKAGADLLADAEYLDGVKTYIRVMTRLRQHEPAYEVLQKRLADSGNALPILKDQVQRQGVTAIVDAQWREQMRARRIETARSGMQAALETMGTTVSTYFTPEERLAFGHFTESMHKGMDADDVEGFAIPLAQSAELADQEARWRFDVALQRVAQPRHEVIVQPLIDLQRRRGRFSELGSQLEQIAAAAPRVSRGFPLVSASDAYHSAAETENELRVLSTLFSFEGLDPNHEQRLFQLLLVKQPQELVRIAAMWPKPSGERAADYAIAHGNPALAHAAVQARGKARPPVWNKAYTALVGLYLVEPTPDINNAFLLALGDDPVAARLAKPVDRKQQLAGKTWFYYGSRYGDYLGTTKLGNADDFLPAILEESPATSSGYLTLGDYYADAGDAKRAIADYEHTVELSPDRPDIYDKLAVVYFKQGDRASALSQWKQAFTVLSKQVNSSHVPESFWQDFGRTCDQLASRHLFSQLEPDADAIVRSYLRHNGTWRSNAILHSAFAAQANPAIATAWLLEISSSANDPARVLGDVADASWIPKAQRAPIYQRILSLQQDSLGKLNGFERQSAQQELESWQERWIRYLVDSKQYAAAADAIVALPDETRESQKTSLVPLQLRAAAQLGTLDAILTTYRSDPAKAPSSEILRDAAHQLFEAGDKKSARNILELVFSAEIAEHKLVATNFLGLAEIRLASGDTAGALELLHRLVVVVGNPFENIEPSAALLERTHHNTEAIEFLDQLVKAVPWEPSYRVRLAKARLAAANENSQDINALQAIASAQPNPYEIRMDAAAALQGKPHAAFGSGELDLLAASPSDATVAAADKFYYYSARIKAAKHATTPEARMQLLSHCAIDFPRRTSARVPLFEAAIQAHSDEYALGILEPLLTTHFLGNSSAATQDQEIAAPDEEAQPGDEASNLNVPKAQLSPTQQTDLASEIAETMQRSGRTADALSYFQAARRREATDSARKQLLRKINEMKEILRIQQENAGRRPSLHEDLEQDRVVRPRLVTKMATSSAAAHGGVKR